uniref:phage tail tape measure protein n=1 Tax=uncultured Duncaniella sp. TaxID=2768039 RepID=UPI002637A699
MSGISEVATVTLNVNGSQAKKVMEDLSNQITATEQKIKQMKDAGADPKAIEKVRRQLTNLKKQLSEAQSATQGVADALNNLDSATPRQLEKALRTLNKQLKDMPPGSEVWQSHVEKIKELKGRLSELRGELEVQESLWDKFRNWINNSGAALVAISLGFDQAVSTLRGYVDTYAEMEQEMANVRKYIGMTEAQVSDLNEEFKKMDTRSSREQLNMLAQEAGRLGKTSKEDILGFVRAADKVNVALDDLGKGATLTLSKLTGIFGVEEQYGTEQALLKTGSVINELSQNCSASAPYIANFTERIGGVGAQANMTIPQIMGFAAVLDANAQQVEASSTALSQIIVRLYQDPAKYARVAGLEVESFSKLMKEDANAALILFLETLQKAGGMDTLSPMFKDMGENGSRAIAALSTLATHIDMVKAQQEAANIAFAE